MCKKITHYWVSAILGVKLPVLVSAGLCATRSEARRAVEQGGVLFADEKVTDVKTTYSKDVFADGVMVRKGKKSFKKVTV